MSAKLVPSPLYRGLGDLTRISKECVGLVEMRLLTSVRAMTEPSMQTRMVIHLYDIRGRLQTGQPREKTRLIQALIA